MMLFDTTKSWLLQFGLSKWTFFPRKMFFVVVENIIGPITDFPACHATSHPCSEFRPDCAAPARFVSVMLSEVPSPIRIRCRLRLGDPASSLLLIVRFPSWP